MRNERRVKILAAAALAVLMAACTTTKTATENPPPAAATTTPAKPATPANGNGSSAEGAEASSANPNGAGLQANTLPGDNGSNGSANAAGKGNGASSGSAGNGSEQAAGGTGTRIFYFDYDSSALQSADLKSLQAHAAYLSKNSSAKVRVEGNADERGTREYNMALGERRAKAVAAYLTSNGASDGQLTIISYGKEKPAVDGHDESAWAKNRRVELNYTDGQP